jgi:hypothetical protein
MSKSSTKVNIKFWVIPTPEGLEKLIQNEVICGTLTAHPALGQCFECTKIKPDPYFLYMEVPFLRQEHMTTHLHIPQNYVMAIIESSESNLNDFINQMGTRDQ